MIPMKIKVTAIEPLLISNPQCVDEFNPYKQKKKSLTSKKKKTDDDLRRIREIDIESALYFDDEIKVYIPSTWVMASIAGVSWSKARRSKADIRASVFVEGEKTSSGKIKLHYKDMEKVKDKSDIVKNPYFVTIMNLKQGQVRLAKAKPIFHKWSFSCTIQFDDTQLDPEELKSLIEHGAKYMGYGDFRPTYGRAEAEVTL